MIFALLFRRMEPGERTFLEDKDEKDVRSYVEIQKSGTAGKFLRE